MAVNCGKMPERLKTLWAVVARLFSSGRVIRPLSQVAEEMVQMSVAELQSKIR